MNNEWNIPRIMDILGALLFLLLLIYFIQKKNKDYVEYILMVFVGTAFVIDIIFVIMYFNGV
jgi:hypothetical protein